MEPFNFANLDLNRKNSMKQSSQQIFPELLHTFFFIFSEFLLASL